MRRKDQNQEMIKQEKKAKMIKNIFSTQTERAD